MKKTGAWLVRYALEQSGIKYTFGIPGVHNTELYDELNNSDTINPILVTHEGHGAFMADAISRTNEYTGTMVIVPAAGVTHAASGIGEASLDGIPMLIISGGVRSDSDFDYQLHDMDQHALLAPITKATFKVDNHQEIVPTIYNALRIANCDEPGPVFVEIPVNLQLDKGDVTLPDAPLCKNVDLSTQGIEQAVQLIKHAKNPGIFAGWGAVHASDELVKLAERLNAPVSTTLQGVSCFPHNHPLHTGMSFGPAAVPAAQNAFKDCDCLIAIGTRFGEIGTGSFGVSVPSNLIHIDINPNVFNKNYEAAVAIESDAEKALQALNHALEHADIQQNDSGLQQQIAADKQALIDDWLAHDSKDRVNPCQFFQSLRHIMADDDYLVVDDGNHTFLSAELMPIHQPRGFISPTDFNCMGYAVPAAIATKMSHPTQQTVAIVGDGAFFMTCMELATANAHKTGVVICVFNDGELSQISQAQQIPYNRKTCSVLPETRIQGIALATGSEYLAMKGNDDPAAILSKATELANEGKPVIVDVHIDYSRPTNFTQGIVKTNLKRMPLGTKVRMISRAVYRKLVD